MLKKLYFGENENENINFWLDPWHEKPIVSILNSLDNVHNNLTARVFDFIVNSQWHFPSSVLHSFPNLNLIAMKVTLPRNSKEDKLVWKSCSTGELSLKDAFLHKYGIGHNISWAKVIWGPDIPPSKSLISWRLMHNKMPTNENLMIRGCNLSSMCSSCQACAETTFHLFSECPFAIKMWSWIASLLNKPL